MPAISAIAALLVPITGMYLWGSFVHWNLDPGDWSAGARLMFGGIAVFIDAVLIGVMSESWRA